MKHLKKTTLVTLMLAGLALASCSKSSDSDKNNSQTVPKTKDTLVVGLSSDAPTLDPALSQDVVSGRVIGDLFEGLVSEDQSNNPVPGVAKSWDISKDGKVYTFHLRDDAKWSNGQPVTAQDFVFALQREMNPATGAPNNNMFTVIKNAAQILAGKAKPDTLGVKAINSQTLQITLENPVPYFLDIMANDGAMPVYIPAVKKDPKGWAKPGEIVSNGAYELKSWVPNGHITEIKNPYYWDAKNVKIDKVKFLPITQPSDELNRYKAGQIDMTYTVPSGLSAAQYKKEFGSQFVNVTGLSSYDYVFNVKAKGVSAVKARKALTMVIDRQAIINSVLRMGQKPVYGILPDGIQSGMYDDIYKTIPSYAWVDQPMAQRIKEAKALLTSLGYSTQKPLKVAIDYNTDPLHQQIAEVIMQMWQKAFGGIVKAQIHNEEWKVYLQNLKNHNYQMSRLRWIANYNGASDFVDQYICGSSNNYANVCDPKIDKEYKLAMASKTQKEFNEHMKLAIIEIMKQYPVLPVYSFNYARLVKPYVGGYDPKNNHMDIVYSKWFYFKHKS